MDDALKRTEHDNQIRKQARWDVLKVVVPVGLFFIIYIIFLPVIQRFFGIID
jgi:hypothetical protein